MAQSHLPTLTIAAIKDPPQPSAHHGGVSSQTSANHGGISPRPSADHTNFSRPSGQYDGLSAGEQHGGLSAGQHGGRSPLRSPKPKLPENTTRSRHRRTQSGTCDATQIWSSTGKWTMTSHRAAGGVPSPKAAGIDGPCLQPASGEARSQPTTGGVNHGGELLSPVGGHALTTSQRSFSPAARRPAASLRVHRRTQSINEIDGSLFEESLDLVGGGAADRRSRLCETVGATAADENE